MTTATAPSYAAPDRFAVSHLGMREVHADRPPWQLVKELIQNVFDEAPPATLCQVTITENPREPDTTFLRVVDDGPGFADIRDSWTLLKPTPKRLDPTKRGRFNLGEKELISVALEATVETAGHTVHFPRLGSRAVDPNDRKTGTVITALMPWNEAQRQELVQRLLRFRPTDCRLTVNGADAPRREPLIIHSAILDTVLQSAAGEPMRHTRRRTDLHLLAPLNPEEPWLYEMGIPIQPIACQWDLDVQQKVPMPPNRDTVRTGYLQDIYAEALNAGLRLMADQDFGEAWVDTAVEDPRLSGDAVRGIVKGRYGEKPILSRPDRDANMQAAEQGHSVINPNSLSQVERERFKQDAHVPTAYDLYGVKRTFNPLDPEIQLPDAANPGFPAFREWVQTLAGYCGLKANVVFYEYPVSVVASCSANTANPLVAFNCRNLKPEFFQPPYNRPEQLELIIHELAHALADKPTEHRPAWGRACATAGARIADGLLTQFCNQF